MVGTYDRQEVEAMVDVAVLRYLKKYNQLPKDLPQVLQPSLTLEEKKAFAVRWMSA